MTKPSNTVEKRRTSMRFSLILYLWSTILIGLVCLGIRWNLLAPYQEATVASRLLKNPQNGLALNCGTANPDQPFNYETSLQPFEEYGLAWQLAQQRPVSTLKVIANPIALGPRPFSGFSQLQRVSIGIHIADLELPPVPVCPVDYRARGLGPGLTDRQIFDLLTVRSLKSLSISHVDLSPQHLQAVAASDSIKHLRLENCAIDDKDLAILMRMTRLETLVLSQNQLTGAGWKDSLQELAALRVLDVRHCPVSDESLLAISQSKSLQQLNLSITCVGNEGVGTLSLNRTLESLNLRGTCIDWKATQPLAKMQSLRKLDISQTSMGQRDYERLASQAPRLLVRYDQGRNFIEPALQTALESYP